MLSIFLFTFVFGVRIVRLATSLDRRALEFSKIVTLDEENLEILQC